MYLMMKKTFSICISVRHTPASRCFVINAVIEQTLIRIIDLLSKNILARGTILLSTQETGASAQDNLISNIFLNYLTILN